MEESLKTLENAARFVASKGLMKYTRFLDPAQAVQAERVAQEYGALFSGFGGYDDAERVMGCFHPADEVPDKTEFPLTCLHARYNQRFSSITHRDLLGAFMALGLTRDCIGDMIISDADVFLFATDGTADFIAASMTSAGKASLHFRPLDHIPQMPAPKGSTFSSVVSSMRLDVILAAAYRLSRSESAQAIHSGSIKVDQLPCERVDAILKEGALLSMRGKGRVRLISVDGLTRKQRIGVTFFRYE